MDFNEKIEQKLSERFDQNILRKLDFVGNFDEFIDFSSSDYLGLSKNNEVIEASLSYLKKYGTSLSSSPILLKNPIYNELSSLVAKAQKFENSILFSSGYIANYSAISAILSIFSEDEIDIFCDKLNHASIHDAINSSKFGQIRYRNTDLNHLEDLLKKSTKKNKIVITESVFSMDGSVLNIDEILILKRKYGFVLYIDEAHSFGVFGENGYGFSQKYSDEIDFCMSSLSKSVASTGGVISASKKNISFLQNFAKGFVYSTAQTPASIGAAIKSIELFPSFESARKKILENAKYLQEKLDENSLSYIKSSSQIVGILCPENLLLKLQDFLKKNGIFASGIRYPTVSKATSRLRICINALHEEKDIDKLVFLIKNFDELR